jgi:hypothetical protein
VTRRHHCCAVSHETSFRYNTSVVRPRLTLVHPERFEGPTTPSRTPRTVKHQTRSKNVTTVAHPDETEHNLSVHRRRATAESLTRPSTGVDNRQDLQATEATLHPCARLAPLPTPRCWTGHCADRSRKATRQKPSTETHPNESSTSSSLASPAAAFQHRGAGGLHSA